MWYAGNYAKLLKKKLLPKVITATVEVEGMNLLINLYSTSIQDGGTVMTFMFQTCLCFVSS